MSEITEKIIGETDTSNATNNVGNGSSMSRVSKKPYPKRKKKDRCYFEKCNSTAVKFIGDCQFCQGHYCSKHRLMESHACQGLKSCKEQMHQRNADKLAAEQTIVPKIQI